MYSYIRGQIIVKTPDYLIVEAGGIGYEVQIHPGMVNALPAVGETAKIPVELSVREDQMTLFGFPGEEEKNLFRLVQTVSGIGPKVAITITGSISPGAFALAILNDDVNVLTTIKGIGKKGAQRLILELKDKLRKLELDLTSTSDEFLSAPDSIDAQAVSALMVLGYRNEEARQALQNCGRTEDDSLETVILKALKTMKV
ncbi:MAG: Holliday junction branch migration protein RuvA [Clostridiaceae bacterium]|jgi:Holliday junction DNA helicase RuvA|nr:Holliday junction branch migration protein RuvA [Clostridiaceae bacterium]